MQTKKEILEMLESGIITVDEALQLIKHTEGKEIKEEQKKEEIKEPPKKTFDEYIDQITANVCKDLDIDNILDFMHKKKWTYGATPVNNESVFKAIRDVIKESISICITRFKKTGDEDVQGVITTQGFRATSFINDEHVVEIEVEFIGDTGCSDIYLDEIIGICPNNSKAIY